jgi:hypothetical protein
MGFTGNLWGRQVSSAYIRQIYCNVSYKLVHAIEYEKCDAISIQGITLATKKYHKVMMGNID